MTIDRATFVTYCRQEADAVSAIQDWPQSFILMKAAQALDEEWGHILGVAPHYRSSVRTAIAVGSDNTFPWSALDGGTSGDTAERTFRVLELRGPEGEYTYTPPASLQLLADPSLFGQSGRVWTRRGGTVQLLGASANQSVKALVSHRPPLIHQLATDMSLVQYPDGWELIPVLHTAALMLMKGGRETDEASALFAAAEDKRAVLLAELRRDWSGPVRVPADDTAAEWGSL